MSRGRRCDKVDAVTMGECEHTALSDEGYCMDCGSRISEPLGAGPQKVLGVNQHPDILTGQVPVREPEGPGSE